MGSLLDVIPSMPIASRPTRGQLVECAKACISAELACSATAAGVLRGSNIDRLRSCFSLCLDTADICGTTGKLLTRNLDSDPEVLRAILEACARASATCGAECLRYGAVHALCKTCADTCHDCERECDRLLQQLTGGLRPAQTPEPEPRRESPASAKQSAWRVP
jgi:hypothetical protein